MNDCQLLALEARLALLDFSERQIKLVMDAVRDCAYNFEPQVERELDCQYLEESP
jgi:hypothetical protein